MMGMQGAGREEPGFVEGETGSGERNGRACLLCSAPGAGRMPCSHPSGEDGGGASGVGRLQGGEGGAKGKLISHAPSRILFPRVSTCTCGTPLRTRRQRAPGTPMLHQAAETSEQTLPTTGPD